MTSIGTKMAKRAMSGLLELATCFGSLAQASKMVGGRRNFLSEARRRGSTKFSAYYDALDEFGATPERMSRWSHCFDESRFSALESFSDEGLAIILRRGRGVGGTPLVNSVRLAYLQGHLPSRKVGVIQDALLLQVDALRYDDAKESESKALGALKRADGAAFAARALGAWASAVKVLGRLDEAHEAIWTAMRIAATEKEFIILGDLTQRAVYVLSERTELKRALQMARAAYDIYRQAGSSDLMGRALVDQGVTLWRDGHGVECEDAMRNALKLLDPVSIRNRCAAYQHIGFHAARTGKLSRAEECVVQAQDCVPEDSHFLPRLFWLRARVAAAAGDLPAAAAHYEVTAMHLGQSTPVESALVSAETTRVLVRLGRFDEAKRLATLMRWAVIGLEDSAPLAAAALADLIMAADEVELFRLQAESIAARLDDEIVAALGERGMVRPLSAV